jgi:hypothetical protein
MEKEKQKTREKTNRKKNRTAPRRKHIDVIQKPDKPNPSLLMGRPGNMIPRAALR